MIHHNSRDWMKLMAVWLPVVLWAGLIFALSSVPHLKTNLGFWDLILRKMAHLVEYAILAWLFARALAGTKDMPAIQLFLVTVIFVLAYAASDEIHQCFVPGRGPSALDVFLDTLGGILGAVTWVRFLS